MTIGKKLTVNASIMMLLMFALGGYALYTISSLGGALNVAVGATATKLDQAQSTSARVQEMVASQRGFLVATIGGNATEAAESRRRMLLTHERIGAHVNEMRPLVETAEGRRSLDALEAARKAILPYSEEYMKFASQGDLPEAERVMNGNIRPLVATMEEASNALVKEQQKSLSEAQAEARSEVNLGIWLAVSLTIVSALVGAFLILVVNGVSKTLGKLATQLGQGSEEVSAAAGQVSSSSQSLSQFASEQAASLEETSASADELNSMTQRNAENTRDAATQMGKAEEVVKEANLHLQQMLKSMEEINASSEKISRIIKVIDEIAFQTNILALNAAVEAARAGEAGMGFAVVADEVRNLAQRSAQAAKDTAELIEDSITRSREGSGKLGEVAAAIQKITVSASAVKALVDEVNMGSQEQARGFDQIAKAIVQMEQVTHQVAANAEEGASASEQLNAQAETVDQIVGELSAMVTTESRGGRRLGDRQARRASAGRPSAFQGQVGKLGSALGRSVAPKAKAAERVHAGSSSAMASAGSKDRFPMDEDFEQF
ncbi:MAG: methyl-accepting chemotaxis protein [Bryobacterales bacterium]|jgi:methyl-accepting chemotaxis protein/methyl-accepting chemotaxis protein-1 (serine sensor receptor)|nr:methyl-accepting chemotaxis protein [Bryobacterales bacterium]